MRLHVNSNEMYFNLLPFQYLERRFKSKLVKYLGTFACVCIMVYINFALVRKVSKYLSRKLQILNQSKCLKSFFKITLQLMYCATVYYGPATAIEGGKIHSKTLEGPPIPLPVILSTIRFIPTRSLLILLTARSVLILLECFVVILKFVVMLNILAS